MNLLERVVLVQFKRNLTVSHWKDTGLYRFSSKKEYSVCKSET